MNQEEFILKGFDFTKELVIQLITLSTGILALSISFSEKLIKDYINNKQLMSLLKKAWICYLVSIICGIWTLMAISGTLISIKPHTCLINSNIVIPQSLQIITFLLSTVFIIRLGFKNIETSENIKKKSVNKTKEPPTISIPTTEQSKPPSDLTKEK